MDEPTVLAGGQGEAIALGPIGIRVLTDTDAYGIAEDDFPPKTPGSPLHTHDWDEAFYVVEGKLEVTAGGEVVIAWPGDYVMIPGGTAHTFAAHGDEKARCVGFFGSRAGLAYLRELAAARDDAAAAEVRARHGVHLV